MPFGQELPMPDAPYDFLIDLIAAQDDCGTDGIGMEPQLVELLLDRQAQSVAQSAAQQSTAHARG